MIKHRQTAEAAPHLGPSHNDLTGDPMASVTDPRTGTCSTHGLVEAERRPPKLTFLFILTGSTRFLVKRKPFRCPECGSPVT